MPTLSVYTEHDFLQLKAQAIAKRLQLPFTLDAPTTDFHLVLKPEYVGLQKTNTASLPLYVDFLEGKAAYRRQNTSLRKEILARAMGLKSNTNPKIVDATAGLGRDSFILASLGFEIILLERSPVIGTLLEDGLQRAAKDPAVADIIKRMHFEASDSAIILPQIAKIADIIYLDPMFPERTKSALVKKDMQILHDIIGADTDADELLKTALACAARRVVVKRPRLAAFLANMTPSFSLPGSSSRFDVYLI
jgi:16S rRNA (guanine1516-N2)-methyltransferase